jgi:putative endopeptidase
MGPDDLFGDVQAVRKFAGLRQVNRLNGPVDRDEWYMSPQTVNASYDASLNEMVFPAGIQRPILRSTTAASARRSVTK